MNTTKTNTKVIEMSIEEKKKYEIKCTQVSCKNEKKIVGCTTFSLQILLIHLTTFLSLNYLLI